MLLKAFTSHVALPPLRSTLTPRLPPPIGSRRLSSSMRTANKLPMLHSILLHNKQSQLEKRAFLSSIAISCRGQREAPAAKLEETHSTLLLRCRPFTLQNQCSKNRDSVRVIEANTALCNCHKERRRIDPQLSKVLHFLHWKRGGSPRQWQLHRREGGVG